MSCQNVPTHLFMMREGEAVVITQMHAGTIPEYSDFGMATPVILELLFRPTFSDCSIIPTPGRVEKNRLATVFFFLHAS